MDDACADLNSERGRRLPLRADIGDEALSTWRCLVELDIGVGAVHADRRRREQPVGSVLCRGDQRGSPCATVEDLPLVRRGPAMVADSRSGEVHDRVGALEGALLYHTLRG